MSFYAWFAKVGPTNEDEPETTYWWSGTGAIEINVGDGVQRYTGTTVNGTQLVSLTAIEESLSQTNRRATITITLPNQETFLAALIDPGPVPVKINWTVSFNGGFTWNVISRTFVGKLSKQGVTGDNVYTINIETITGADRFGSTRDISFEKQINEHPQEVVTKQDGTTQTLPADDSFFMLPALGSVGVNTRWPRDN